MNRPAIPAEIRRLVLVEAGHRCAIPTCRYPSVDVHHIIPWEKCQSHDFENLIALCPNCHRRADLVEIDRMSLRLYKTRLSAAFGQGAVGGAANDYQVEKLTEVRTGKPGYEFEFEFPVFTDKELLVVSNSLSSWGCELLFDHRRSHRLDAPYEDSWSKLPNTTSASFEIIRNDEKISSIKYRVSWYGSGAAHANGYTVTRNYLKNPLCLIRLSDLFDATKNYLQVLSDYCVQALLNEEGTRRDEKWVRRGAAPEEENFRAFNLTRAGLLFTFDEYQVDCFAAGPQTAEVPYQALSVILNKRVDLFS